MKALLAISLCSIFSLGGCVIAPPAGGGSSSAMSSTPYEKMPSGIIGNRGGYDDQQLAPDVFRVSFVGNGFTPKQDAISMLMRRASEVTKSHGYSYFSIVSEATKWSGGWGTKPTPVAFRTYTPSDTALLKGGEGAGLTAIFVPEGFPWCAILIKCYNTRPKGNNSYSAAEILAQTHLDAQ